MKKLKGGTSYEKKLLSMVMAGTLALSFTACGGSSSTGYGKKYGYCQHDRNANRR